MPRYAEKYETIHISPTQPILHTYIRWGHYRLEGGIHKTIAETRGFGHSHGFLFYFVHKNLIRSNLTDSVQVVAIFKK